MGVLNFIAGLAAIVLAIELFILVLVIAAVCGGLWFGLRFAEKKASPAFAKVNGYVELARRYEKTALGIAVKPVIQAHEFGALIAGTLGSLVERAQGQR